MGVLGGFMGVTMHFVVCTSHKACRTCTRVCNVESLSYIIQQDAYKHSINGVVELSQGED